MIMTPTFIYLTWPWLLKLTPGHPMVYSGSQSDCVINILNLTCSNMIFLPKLALSTVFSISFMASQFSSMSEAKHLRFSNNFSLAHPVCNHLQILYRHLHYRTKIWPFPFPSALHTYTHTTINWNTTKESCIKDLLAFTLGPRQPILNTFLRVIFWPKSHITSLLNSKPFMHVCICAQSCPILCHPMDCSLTGSSVHGIFQARIMEWVAISFSRGSSWSKDRTHVSCVSCIGRQVFCQLSHQGPSLPN